MSGKHRQAFSNLQSCLADSSWIHLILWFKCNITAYTYQLRLLSWQMGSLVPRIIVAFENRHLTANWPMQLIGKASNGDILWDFSLFYSWCILVIPSKWCSWTFNWHSFPNITYLSQLYHLISQLCHLKNQYTACLSSDTVGWSSDTVGLNKWYLVSCVSWKSNYITWKGWLRCTKSTAWSVKMNNIAYCSHVIK